MNSPIIEATAISKSFGKVPAVQGVDLGVEQGSVVALLGPNGAGKTTTLRMLTTLTKPDKGSIAIAGYDVLRQVDRVRSQIGVTGQSVSLDDTLTGLQNLTMVGRLYHLGSRISRKRTIELLSQFGLTDAARRAVGTYSGGMRRRLDLAASLVAMPPILFLDEPTTGLDPQSRNDVWKTVRDLVSKGTTVLLTTQYLEEADQLADIIFVIDHGRIIAKGTPADLKDKLSSERLDITLKNPDDTAKAPKLFAKASSDKIRKDTFSFTVVSGEKGLQEIVSILQQLVTAGVAVKEYSVQRPTLEEVFLRLVSRGASPNLEGDK